jgi:aspartyl/glutamyl-tRNA(Asn/Gln) amidotransferase C subunit
MHIEDDLLDHLAHLAALDLAPAGRELLRSQLERILDYAAQLPPLPDGEALAVDTEFAPPREDVVRSGFTPEAVRAIVPAHEGDFIRVPPVLGGRD